MNERLNLITFPATPSLFRATELVWYVLTIVQLVLLARFFLKLFGISQTSTLVSSVYDVTSYLVYPFTSLLESSTRNTHTVEWTALVAVLAYWLLAIGIIKLFNTLKPPLSKVERARALSKSKYSY